MRFQAVCALYMVVVLAGCSQTLSQISNENGFQRFQAPQKVLEPGTLITFEESGEGLTAITPICWRHQAYKVLRPARSVPGTALDLKRQLGDWHFLEPAYLKNLQEKFPEVKDIELRLQNARVVENSDTELYKGLPTRSKSCQAAITAREANGELVYTILKVLKADVMYKVIGVDRNRLAGKIPQKSLERLKAELGGSSLSTFEQTIKGTALPMAFQADIIGIVPPPTSLGETDSVPPMGAESMASTEGESVPPLKSTGMPMEEGDSAPDVEKRAISDAEPDESPKVSRLTKTQKKLMIKKMAILSRGTSDVDRYQK